MKLRAIISLIPLMFGMINGAISQGEFPDVIIGDPNHAENDILGPAISEKELEESLSLKIKEDKINEDTDHVEEDPISTSGFFQGDIMVQSEDQLFQILQGDPEGQLSAIKNARRTWTKGIIPYVITSSFTSQERRVIARAMAEYHQRSCIRFVPRKTHDDYIHILKGQGCSSTVGRRGGVQVVSLGNGCVHFGVIIHELMHATGFWHEQSRYDRDNYVTIYWSNILSGLQFNFDKKSNGVTTNLGLPYDYNSVMHYDSYAFTKRDGTPTMVAKKNGITLGQRDGFSELDVKGLNLLYKCPGVKLKPTPNECTDEHRFCSSWSTKGYCNSNAGYMLLKCKKSCNVCGETVSCTDNAKHCKSWAAKGECLRNPIYMQKSCKKSCKLCGTRQASCQDQNEFCQDWASKGECSKNPDYMAKSCSKSCDMC